MQIYADFSGYTDIAIPASPAARHPPPRNLTGRTRRSRSRTSGGAGTSRCRAGCGTTLHPLGGGRALRPAPTGNLMLTMVLGGLWHGASWTFVVWGALHGLYQCVGHWRSTRRAAQEEAGTARRAPDPAATAPGAGVAWPRSTWSAWIFFRAESFLRARAHRRDLRPHRPLPRPDPPARRRGGRHAGRPVLPRWIGDWSRAGFSRMAPRPPGRRLAVAFVGTPSAPSAWPRSSTSSSDRDPRPTTRSPPGPPPAPDRAAARPAARPLSVRQVTIVGVVTFGLFTLMNASACCASSGASPSGGSARSRSPS